MRSDDQPGHEASGIPVAVFYHRPIEDPYHGGSRHCKGFVVGLENQFPVTQVCPPWVPAPPGVRRDQGDVRLKVVKYLIQAFLATIRFIVQDGTRRPATDRSRVLVAFDVYLAGVAAVWSRVRRSVFVYYPQDAGPAVADGWSSSGVRGAWLFRAFRFLPERIGVAKADLLLVPSEAMRDDYRREGVEDSRILRCSMKRSMPRYESESVEAWRKALGLGDHVGVVFVGSFQYPPNVRAFEFVRDSLSHDLRQRNPEIRILVAGLDSEPFARDLPPNVRVLGTVEDLDGLLYASTVGIAPMDVAGGTSGKIIDFLLHGLPTVATPQAAVGVEASDLLHVAPLDRFADEIFRLVQGWKPTPDRSFPPAADSTYAEVYTGSADIDAIAEEIRARVLSSRFADRAIP